MKKIWITWQLSQRTLGLSEALELPLVEYTQEGSAIQRHILSSLWTIFRLVRYRPDLVCLQYSFMLLIIISLYKKIYKKQAYIICDCHTKALKRSVSGRLNGLFWYLKRKSFSNVDLAIISNSGLIDDIASLTDSYMILPDRIPDLHKNDSCNNQSEYCVFVCSYAIDEPVSEMIEAGLLLDDVMPVYITGRIPRAMSFLKNQPYKNITFTDFISSEKYQSLIDGAAVIVALTTEEDCLQCAGYEALSLNRPLVVSSTRALRDYFKDSAVYTSSNPKDIRNAVIEAQKSSVSLRCNERELKEIREMEFKRELEKLKNTISQD